MSLPTSERFFPLPTTRKDMCRETLVLWIIEDEPVPSPIEFWSICKNIVPALSKEGYRGKTKLEGFLVNPNKEISQEHLNAYRDYGIGMFMDPEGDEVMRYNKMLIFITFWAFNVTFAYNLSNLLVVSRNKNIGQDSKFRRLLETLKNRGIHVTVAHPDTLETLDQRLSSHLEDQSLVIGEISVCRVCSSSDEEC